MFLLWGPQLICFYSDADRSSLGENGKHPDILGMLTKEAWCEKWDIIELQIAPILNRQGGTWNEELLVPVFRNGEIEDMY